MIKSINAWAFNGDRAPADIFRIAKEQGFEAVELTVSEDGPFSLGATEDECKRIRGVADELEVKIASLATGFGWGYPMTSDDEATRKRGIEINEKCLHLAHWLGTDALLVVPGGVDATFVPGFGRVGYEAAHRRTLEAMAALRPVAEGTGVAVAIENVWNMFLMSPLEMRDLIDRGNSARIGAYFDVGNVIAFGYPEDWIRILGPRIKRVHFKDFKRSVGNLDGFCDLLDGDVDYPAVIDALNEVGYDGYVTAEFFNCEADLPKISAAMDKILGR